MILEQANKIAADPPQSTLPAQQNKHNATLPPYPVYLHQAFLRALQLCYRSKFKLLALHSRHEVSVMTQRCRCGHYL